MINKLYNLIHIKIKLLTYINKLNIYLENKFW